MSKIAVVVQGGLGDNIIYAARLRSLLAKHQAHRADFYLIQKNIYPAVLDMIVELLESQDNVENVFYYRGPITGGEYKTVVDWTHDTSPMKFPIEKNWKAQWKFGEAIWANMVLEGVTKPITFYPYTMGSNPNNEHEKYIRSPKEDWWRGLFEAVYKAGGQPIVLGGPNEKVEWDVPYVIPAYSETENWMWNIPLLYYITGHVGIASWPWQLTHYYGMVDTNVIWINNQFWIDRSVSEDQSKLHIYQEVPTYETIISNLGVLHENN